MSDRSPAAPRRSRITVEGLDRTPHRAFLRAMGHDDAAMAKPFVGVMSTHGENTPCSLSLRPQAEAAKLGVAAAGGTPFEFTTISVSDGVSMSHRGMRMSLLSRELIADSIELVMRGHAYDALVGFAGCDKTLPGIMMGMVRLNCPSVFVYGGAMLPGQWHGRPVSAVTVYEGVGAVMAGAMSEADLASMERECSPTVGSCPGQFTANTMAMVSETLGLALPGSAMLPAVYSRAPRACAPGRRDGAAHPGRRRAAAARPRHAEEPRERLRSGGRHRRIDQRGAAPARDRARGGHPLHARRCRRRVPADAAHRQPPAGRRVPGARSPLRGWRGRGPEGAARRRLSSRRRARAERPDAGGRARIGARAGRQRRVPGIRADSSDGRRGGAEGKSLPGRRAHQDRRAQVPHLRRTRARVRVRGGVRGGGAGPLVSAKATCS